MKIVKGFAKYLGIAWMIIFGGFGAFYHLSNQSFNFNSGDGIASFLVVLIGILILFIPGFLLFRWGSKAKKKTPSKNIDTSVFNHLKGVQNLPLESFEPIKLPNNSPESEGLPVQNKNSKTVLPKKSKNETAPKESSERKVKVEQKGGQVFPVNFRSPIEETPSLLNSAQPIVQFEEVLIEMDYSPNSTWIQKGQEKNFPYVTMPKAGTKVLLPNPGKLKSSGITEADFKIKLLDAFGKHILSQHFLVFKGAKNNYEPDFVFMERSRGLLIDIEIDEPYSGKSRNPMHYEGNSDIDRDHYFNKNGWVVIRFAEEQVVKNPHGCLKFIAAVIDSLLETAFSASFSKADPLVEIPEHIDPLSPEDFRFQKVPSGASFD